MTNKIGKQFYHLLHELHQELMGFELMYMKTEAFENLTTAEIHTLERIGHLQERTMSELARKAEVKQSSMTTMIDRLVRKGYVIRTRDTEDRRVVHVTLSDAGRKVHERHDLLHEQVAHDWLASLEQEEQQELIRLLKRVADAV